VLVIACALAAIIGHSQVWSGTPPPVPAPSGCKYEEELGVDSWAGVYKCKQGLRIEHDIGDLAGVYVSNDPLRGRKFDSIQATEFSGHKVLFGFTQVKHPQFIVSIPDLTANFIASGNAGVLNRQKELVLTIASEYAKAHTKDRK
jgi:hypothetical protein